MLRSDEELTFWTGTLRRLLGSDCRVLQVPSSSAAHAMKNAVRVKTEKWRDLIGDG